MPAQRGAPGAGLVRDLRFQVAVDQQAVGDHVGGGGEQLAQVGFVAAQRIARLIAEFLQALDLRDVVLVGNDSGGAYSQIAAAEHPERIGRLVLNSCETPWCSWPPGPGGFGLLKAAAQLPVAHRLLYQVLRVPSAWRWRNTYGLLAKRPINAQAMRSNVRPVLTRPESRHDGRKAIRSVSPRYSRNAAERLRREFPKPVLCLGRRRARVSPRPRAAVRHGPRRAAPHGGRLVHVHL